MFIFYEFRPFCIDNARVIYRKIRYLEMWNTQVFLEHMLNPRLGIELQPSSLQYVINL